jgi:hypothetical protein
MRVAIASAKVLNQELLAFPGQKPTIAAPIRGKQINVVSIVIGSGEWGVGSRDSEAASQEKS